tara:strand:+ start:146 stop:286 length:141 start_codon:yes stop_codon:yes gene_type:complete
MSESTKQKISKSKKTRKNNADTKKAELGKSIRHYNVISDEEYLDET